MAKNNLILNLFIGALSEGGQLLLTQLLDDIHEHNDKKPEVYEELIKTGNHFANLLAVAAKETKTTVDDRLVNMIQGAVAASAANNGVEL